MKRTFIGFAALVGLLLATLAPVLPAQGAGFSISGTVTVPFGFDVTAVTVTLYDEDWDEVDETAPDTLGDYQFANVSSGQYQVEALGTGLSATDSGWFNVSADVSDKDLDLLEAFTVSGSVSSSAGAVTVGYVEFYATCADWNDGDAAGYAYFDDGTYSVNLPTGSYRVRIVVYSGAGVSSWHSARNSCINADSFTVSGNSTLNLVTLPGSQIQGTVRYNGVGVSDSYVEAYRWEDGYWDDVRYTETASNGTYTLNRLTAGRYKIYFDGYNSTTLNLSGQWWNGAPTLQVATEIVLADGQTVTGIDASLQKSASISGIVTGPTGARKDVDVTVFDSASGDYIDDTESALDGSWKMVGLDPGTYYVRFQEAGGANREFWNNKATANSADTFTLTAGQQLTGLNAWLGSPDPCEFQNNCPAPPPPPAPPTPAPPADQTVKVPPKSVKKGKSVKLASKTAQGSTVTWKATPTRVCKIKKKKSTISLKTLKKGKCKVTAKAPASNGYNALSRSVKVKVK